MTSPAAGTIARGNDLTISIRRAGGAYEMTINVAGAPKDISKTIDEQALLTFNRLQRPELEEVRRRLGGSLKHTDANVQLALSKLHEIGRAYWGNLLGEGEHGASRLINALDQQFSQRRGPLAVEAKTPTHLTLPLEIMPISPPPINREPVQWANALPAFRASIRHLFLEDDDDSNNATPERQRMPVEGGRISQDRTIHLTPELRVLFLWNASAPAAALTRTLLERHRSSNQLALEGPFPSRPLQNNTKALASLLVDGEALRTVSIGPVPAQLVHVHAHAEIGLGRIVASGVLKFAYYDRTRLVGLPTARPVDVRDADIRTVADGPPPIPPMQSGPIIFFSACAAAAGSERGAGAFINIFLQRGYRCVIGPRIDIPGIVAHNVWKSFLHGVMAGLSVGHATYYARKHLFRVGNPLGALVAVYGRTDLAIPSQRTVR